VICGSLILSACGASDDEGESDEVSVGNTAEALCAGGGLRRSEYIVTSIACPFEQQLANIVRYGEEMTPTTFYDASNRQIGAMTYSCDVWWRGTDPDGVDIVVNSVSGLVRSHGLVHPGQLTSLLPEYVEGPFSSH
jgi:hypothetical protein